MSWSTDWVVISDGNVTLGIGGDIDQDFDFTIPANADTTTRPLLAFVFKIQAGDQLSFQVVINGSTEVSYTFTADFLFTSVHEVIAANLLKHGTNKINFRVSGLKGLFTFSDVVLFWSAKTA